MTTLYNTYYNIGGMVVKPKCGCLYKWIRIAFCFIFQRIPWRNSLGSNSDCLKKETQRLGIWS